MIKEVKDIVGPELTTPFIMCLEKEIIPNNSNNFLLILLYKNSMTVIGVKIINFRYAGDTVIIADTLEGLQIL